MTPPEQPERPRQEGNVHHLETQLRARVQMMIAWEMRREAREIIKKKLKAQGVKVSLMAASEITRLAHAHLRAHSAELLAAAEASGVVQRLREECWQRSEKPNTRPAAPTQSKGK